MSGEILVAGLGVAILTLYLLYYKLSSDSSNNHGVLKILFLGFIVGLLVLVGKVSLDYNDHCSWLIINDTIDGSLTTYGYDYICETNTNNTSSLFYNATLWIFLITIGYIFIFYFYQLWKYFDTKRKGGED